jgi:hypothetical protein
MYVCARVRFVCGSRNDYFAQWDVCAACALPGSAAGGAASASGAAGGHAVAIAAAGPASPVGGDSVWVIAHAHPLSKVDHVKQVCTLCEQKIKGNGFSCSMFDGCEFAACPSCVADAKAPTYSPPVSLIPFRQLAKRFQWEANYGYVYLCT